ncbi:Cytochrome c, mono-and diheme variants [Mucilaginibacter gossypiicola]|uniref:Cytochrome c, mono-and diheme variants n=1 Tax=Mucilaginibacter gossypiicola TaxID=551995 RepID=A0A1H7ZQR5_9SPHI|nr:cytochrome c [Mucilaginibacter gossypiicola]SEM60621.1 Cytochrome c, mono-and diheme variants [Mucilaginibacter gossypiicola]
MDFKKALLLLFIILFTSVALQAQTKHKKPAGRKPAAGLKASITRGQALFTQYCVACHQADGLGVPHMNPPLVKTTYVLGDKSKLIKIVLNGFDEDVEINGETYSNTMAAHDFMKDQEIADVLTFVRNSFGNKASAVTIAQVKATRATNKK